MKTMLSFTSLALVGIFAGAQNVTNRRNFAGYAWDRRNNRPKLLEQLGAFPIVGLEWPF